MQALLDFEEGGGSVEDVFGITFTASKNPLVSNYSSSTSSCSDMVRGS